MSSNQASTSSPIFYSPSKVEGFIILNSHSKWYTCFILLIEGVCDSSHSCVLLEDLSSDLDSLLDFSDDCLLVSLFTYVFFDLLFSAIFRNNISFNFCCSSYVFLNIFSLSALKLLSSTMRLLIVSSTWEVELFLIFYSWFCWLTFPLGLISSSFHVNIL